MVRSVSIVLLEDDALLRDLLSRIIQERFAPRELHCFGRGDTGLAHCLMNPPDLLVTDLRLPELDGRAVVRRLRERGITPTVVVLTGHVYPSLPSELLSLGVAGFIDKSTTLDHAEQAIERALSGGLYFSASVPPMPIPAEAGVAQVGVEALTERERAIAIRVAAGAFSKEIGAELGLSPRTIEKMRLQIMAKLGTKDLPALVRWCVRNGLA